MAELQVSRKNIASLLSMSDSANKDKLYVIPEYQRPYRWGENECDTLWTDIKNFFNEKRKSEDAPKEYFIGTIVTCTDEANKNEINIIDGQQRMTSLMLLLRAFYLKLEKMKELWPNDEDIEGLMQQIEPCIWKVDKMSRKVKDRTLLKIDSRVALDKDNDDFKNILCTGEKRNSNSAYAKNYTYFFDQCEKFAAENTMMWKELCLTILNDCIVFPIECEDLNSALTIFSTLNNRGLPLSDSDIFKAELYKKLKTPDEKSAFTDEWKNLEELVEDSGLSINDMFRFYMHVIRARDNVTDNEKGLRKFYAGDNYKYDELHKDNFFENIKDLAKFWVNTYDNVGTFDEDNLYYTKEAIKYIHCLVNFPNDYWRCVVSVFYIKHRGEDDFKEHMEKFMRGLLSYMLVQFIVKPQVNAIKPPTYKFCIDIYHNGDTVFQNIMPIDFAGLIERSSRTSGKVVKSVILLNSYLFDVQSKLLTGKLEIEHILPKRWKEANYAGWTRDSAEEHLESIGNKIPFEKRPNIRAGNGYFGEKKRYYITSHVKEVQDLATNHTSDDWLPEDIERRRDEVCNRLITFFSQNLVSSVTEVEQETQLLFAKKGKESVKLDKVVGNGITRYRLAINRNIPNPTAMQAISGTIPVTTTMQEFADIIQAKNAIDFGFFASLQEEQSISDEFKAILENE